MFDVPRFNKPLLNAIQKLTAPFGGVRYLVLSHSDDVADDERWAEALGTKRVMHSSDVNARQGTDKCEIQLRDSDFLHIFDNGCELLHVPGHTKGCIALLHRATDSLFTGDHLFYSATTGLLGGPAFAPIPSEVESILTI